MRQLHLDPAVGELLHQPGAPFDGEHAVRQVDVQIEVVDLGQGAQPVGVDVHERHPAVAMDSRDDERRRHHRATDAETGAETLDEYGLAGTKRSGEHDQIARAEQSAELAGRGDGCRRTSGAGGRASCLSRAARPPGYADVGQRVFDELERQQSLVGFGRSSSDDVASIVDEHQLGVRQPFRHLSAVRRRSQQIVVAAEDQHFVVRRESSNAASLSCAINAG